ncbi:pitrilysin family protein [Patulibacter sp. SYSU D01012]|uniref:M16 family metallopeptidase n=1 Tax=Patulibacter sp. SYSU D01012 TaxID=2817381 RepID=UPI001B30FE62|nr:pitrilysin family protein [Patulibacter sp. SYSU D01012]
MPQITSTVAPNGLPIHRIAMPGTRTLTALVAFDAGARAEREEENGIAHFLEHLVFKGGETYDHYRKVNETAERMGGVLNAFTSHSMVAFHITVRAEAAAEALDLLTDFAGRPKLDADELDKERGVVIQEIARYHDQPSALAEQLLDRATFGDHPLGRTVLGPADHLRTFTRDQVVAFRERRWSGRTGGAFLVGAVDHLPDDAALGELFARFPDLEHDAGGVEPAPAPRTDVVVEERDTNQSHLRVAYRPDVDAADPATRAALQIYGTLLGGSMGSRLFDEIREQRGLAYSVSAGAWSLGDTSQLQLSAGLDSTKCLEAYGRMREIVAELHEDGPTAEEVERARAYSAGRLVLAFENSGAVARHAASQAIVHGEGFDTDEAVARLDAVTLDDVREVARRIDPNEASVACVGPHGEGDFGWSR